MNNRDNNLDFQPFSERDVETFLRGASLDCVCLVLPSTLVDPTYAVGSDVHLTFLMEMTIARRQIPTDAEIEQLICGLFTRYTATPGRILVLSHVGVVRLHAIITQLFWQVRLARRLNFEHPPRLRSTGLLTVREEIMGFFRREIHEGEYIAPYVNALFDAMDAIMIDTHEVANLLERYFSVPEILRMMMGISTLPRVRMMVDHPDAPLHLDDPSLYARNLPRWQFLLTEIAILIKRKQLGWDEKMTTAEEVNVLVRDSVFNVPDASIEELHMQFTLTLPEKNWYRKKHAPIVISDSSESSDSSTSSLSASSEEYKEEEDEEYTEEEDKEQDADQDEEQDEEQDEGHYVYKDVEQDEEQYADESESDATITYSEDDLHTKMCEREDQRRRMKHYRMEGFKKTNKHPRTSPRAENDPKKFMSRPTPYNTIMWTRPSTLADDIELPAKRQRPEEEEVKIETQERQLEVFNPQPARRIREPSLQIERVEEHQLTVNISFTVRTRNPNPDFQYRVEVFEEAKKDQDQQ